MKDSTGGILVTDIDMIPMNNTYYSKNIESYDSDKFIYFRGNVMMNRNQIAICYNVAHYQTWKNIFELYFDRTIENENDILECLLTVYKKIDYNGLHGGKGWSTDQLHLFEAIKKWNNENFITLLDSQTGYKRLDRISNFIVNNILDDDIRNGVYSDYHMFRPYNRYKTINDHICDLL